MFSKITDSFRSILPGSSTDPGRRGTKRQLERDHDDCMTENKRSKNTSKPTGFAFGKVAEWLVRGKRSFEDSFYWKSISPSNTPVNMNDAHKATGQKPGTNSNGHSPSSHHGTTTPYSQTTGTDYKVFDGQISNAQQRPVYNREMTYSSGTVNSEPQYFGQPCYTSWQANRSTSIRAQQRSRQSQLRQNGSYQSMYDKTFKDTSNLHNSSSNNMSKVKHRDRSQHMLAAKEIIRMDEKKRYAQLLQQYTSSSVINYSHLEQAKSLSSSTLMGSQLSSSLLGSVFSTKLTTATNGSSTPQKSMDKITVHPHKSCTTESSNGHVSTPYNGTNLPFPKWSGLKYTRSTSSTSGVSEGSTSEKSIIVIEDDAKQQKAESTKPPPVKAVTEEKFVPPRLTSVQSSDYHKNKLKSSPYGSNEWLQEMKDKHYSQSRQLEKDLELSTHRVQFHEQQRIDLENTLLKRLDRKLRISARQPAIYAEDFESDEEEVDEFPELGDEAESQIDDALRPRPGHQVLSEGFRLQITRADMDTLNGLNWLNDEIINFYMELLRDRGKADNFPSVHVFNTFFYPKVMSNGHQGVRRWTKQVDLFTMDYIVVPVHLGMHWCMSVVDFRKKQICYLDSMGGRNDPCIKALKAYLQAESLAKKKEEYNMTDWEYINVKDIPHQMNGSDCGVFACKFAEYITRDAKITFSQENMPYFRRRMVYEILTKKLL